MLLQTCHGRRAALALASGCLLLGMVAHVRAGDEDGFGSLFQRLFAPPPSAAPQVEPVPVGQPLPAPVRARRAPRPALPVARRLPPKAAVAAAAAAARAHPRTRYAALPRPEAVEKRRAAVEKRPVAEDARAAALAKAGDPSAALMRDTTLRPGDIVVTAAGARVFTGRPGDRHRAGDFEDATRSRRLDGKTRRLVSAMVAPAGAVPAAEAHRLLARLQRERAVQETAEPVARATASLVRVVYPAAEIYNAAGRGP
ncbi:conserved hypothetical protein [Methylobacterium sp. 4-46]|uniref:hypothetical protein n=1 Tax=unclassified Methylobacterium TaxID=2615210 RepID=UPI000165CB56|nr:MULTISPECIES: hypothetical protein [Methylobacterium]ACA18974.1 conserved hypothetical protein [Methylobacterium sp. 4-46]WFT78193.1 hypothetical protein QA634_23265 [Methylobacterium nodulans]